MAKYCDRRVVHLCCTFRRVTVNFICYSLSDCFWNLTASARCHGPLLSATSDRNETASRTESMLFRVTMGVHTLEQVLVGAFVGCFYAYLWNNFMRFQISKFYPWIESLSVAKYFYIFADSDVSTNFLEFEYDANMKGKQRKST